MSDNRRDRDAYDTAGSTSNGNSINDTDPPPSVRRPRMRVVLLGGGAGGTGASDGRADRDAYAAQKTVEIPGLAEANVTNNAHYQPDKFSAHFALYVPDANNLAWWSEQTAAMLDIQFGLDDGDNVAWTSLIQGEVDHVEVHPATGLVQVEGRDLTARLIEARTQETFKNQTSSQVATTLAGRHGLTADVTATTTLVTRYYEADHDHVTLNEFSRTTTEWDLLTYLAERENFDCYVTGTTLHFKPRVTPTDKPFAVVWQRPEAAKMFSNVIDLRLERSLTLAGDVEVWVRSWDSRHAKGFTKKARAIGAKGASSKNSRTQRTVIVRPNLTEDEAQKLANATLAQITKNERIITFHMPGNTLLTTRNMVALRGTDSTWDQVYFVDTIDRRMSFQSGFTMDVRCKNHDSQSQTIIG